MASAGNTINYLSLSCQMFSTIISYNKSFNSAANQIEWSTFRKCCHCILVGSTNCRERIISHINFPWATNASLVSGEIMKIWNIDEGDVLCFETRYQTCSIFPKKLFLAPDSVPKSIALSYFDGRDLCRHPGGLRSDQYQSAESQFQLFLSMGEHHPPV